VRAQLEPSHRSAALAIDQAHVGLACGSFASTWVYARAGWGGVCGAGAAISALAFAFWASTLSSVAKTPNADT
jgi:predicted MFS family arabinose efflux permease